MVSPTEIPYMGQIQKSIYGPDTDSVYGPYVGQIEIPYKTSLRFGQIYISNFIWPYKVLCWPYKGFT